MMVTFTDYITGDYCYILQKQEENNMKQITEFAEKHYLNTEDAILASQEMELCSPDVVGEFLLRGKEQDFLAFLKARKANREAQNKKA